MRALWLLVPLLAGCVAVDPAPVAEASYPEPATDDDLASTGRWLPPFDGEVPAVNLVLLHDGRLLYWSGVEANGTATSGDLTFITAAPDVAQSRILRLEGGNATITRPLSPDGAGDDLFCAGATVLADGRVLAVGATEWHTLPDLRVPVAGGADARIFDPITGAWTRVGDMHEGRWYPSTITLADGTPLVASGISTLIDPSTHVESVETYDVAADRFDRLHDAERLLPLYPRLTVLPGGPLQGEVAYNTVGALWGPFGAHPAEATWSLQQTLDVESRSWTTHGPSLFGARQHGSSVMLPLSPADDYAPRFLTFGGTLQRSVVATPTAELNDFSTSPPTNRLLAPLAEARWHANGVLLADGSVLAVGGGAYDNVVVHGMPNIPVLATELFDASRGWTTLAAMDVPRMYHSTAVLLPDGRVLAGGHVPLPNPSPDVRGTANPQVVETRFQVFEPPYLFRGERPVIEAAPASIGHGATFEVKMERLGELGEVMLVRPGATTHGYDAEQRVIRLAATHVGDVVTITAPPDGLVAPPGYYMLFIHEAHPDGPVPSVAAFVHLGGQTFKGAAS